jgi:RsiW-degrading membrane proteinase PrsW (M82 family)
MSFFKLGMDSVQEFLVLALMLVFVFAVIYSNISLTYKVGIGLIVITLILVSSMANQALKQQKEEEKKRLR